MARSKIKVRRKRQRWALKAKRRTDARKAAAKKK
jgi:hypothetical protein